MKTRNRGIRKHSIVKISYYKNRNSQNVMQVGEKTLKKRSISYCKFDIIQKGRCTKNIDALRQVVNMMGNLSVKERTQDFNQSEKSVTLASVRIMDQECLGLIFKSGKYGHVASLINRFDGSERETDKTMDEGEKELTHVCMKFTHDSAIFALEGNRDGIGAQLIMKYFQQYLNSIDSSLKLQLSYLSTTGMSDILEKASRIISVEVDCTYKDSNEDIFREIYGDDVRDTYTVMLRPERRRSLPINKIKSLYEKTKKGDKFRRIRISMRTNEGDDVVLDSLMDRVRDKVDVMVDSHGIVLSESILSSLRKYLLAFEEKTC